MLCKGLAAVQWLHQANVQRGHAGVTQAGAEGQVWAGGTGGGQAQVLGEPRSSELWFPHLQVGTAVTVIIVRS